MCRSEKLIFAVAAVMLLLLVAVNAAAGWTFIKAIAPYYVLAIIAGVTLVCKIKAHGAPKRGAHRGNVRT